MEYMDPSMKERDKAGRYTESVSDDEIVDYVRERGGVTTSDVAAEFDYERPTAYRRLKALEEKERVTARTIGNSLLWEAVSNTEQADTPGAPRDAPSDAPRDSFDEPGRDTALDEDRRSDEPAPATEHQVIDLDSVDVPGSGEKAANRREAVSAALKHIREQGEATPSDLKESVYPEHKGGYTAGKDPARSWWKNSVYPALREIAERDHRLAKADQTGRWSWRGE